MSYRSPQELVEAFKDWGIDVRPYEPDGRPWYAHTTNGGWDPWGVAHHHTAGSRRLLTSGLSQRAMLRLLRNGRTGLPGPLCHFSPALDPRTGKGVLHLVGWGNVNHAGLVDATNLRQVRRGNYAGRQPRADQVDGNVRLYGLEYMHPGDSTPWPDELLHVGHLCGAAIGDAHGWSADAIGGSQIEHKQLTRRKIDRSWHGDVWRAVQDVYDAGPGAGGFDVNLRDVWQVKMGGGDGHKASLWLIWSANRSKRAQTASARANKHARQARNTAQRVEADLADLRQELPELVEHAAARGAQRALADNVVRAKVDVTVDGQVVA